MAPVAASGCPGPSAGWLGPWPDACGAPGISAMPRSRPHHRRRGPSSGRKVTPGGPGRGSRWIVAGGRRPTGPEAAHSAVPSDPAARQAAGAARSAVHAAAVAGPGPDARRAAAVTPASHRPTALVGIRPVVRRGAARRAVALERRRRTGCSTDRPTNRRPIPGRSQTIPDLFPVVPRPRPSPSKRRVGLARPTPVIATSVRLTVSPPVQHSPTTEPPRLSAASETAPCRVLDSLRTGTPATQATMGPGPYGPRGTRQA